MIPEKLTEPFEITQKTFEGFVEGTNPVVLAMLYTISKHHEKYRITQWCLEQIEKRGMTKQDIAYFDDQFEIFYNQMLTQDNL